MCCAKEWWTGEDSNLRSPQGAADLQSAGFSHSPTRPHGKPPSRSNAFYPSAERHLFVRVIHTKNRLSLCYRRSAAPTPLRPKISWRRDLNPRPSDYKSDALPTELRQRSSNQGTISKGHLNCKGEVAQTAASNLNAHTNYFGEVSVQHGDTLSN